MNISLDSQFIDHLDIVYLISGDDIVSIKKLTLILKIIGHCDIKQNMTKKKRHEILIYIITSIAAHPVSLAVILVIMSVSTF